MKKIINLVVASAFILSCNPKTEKQEQAFTANDSLAFFNKEKKELKSKYAPLQMGQILPAGWLKKQIERDLENGLVGVLDKLAPPEMEDDLYCEDQRTEIPDIEGWQKEQHWWRGEQQGYWRDGLLRNALLVDNKEEVKRMKNYVEHIIDCQDEDGYIGIYSEDLRFSNFEGNGELWDQARVFHVMLTWYEISENEKVLESVKKAIDRIMQDFNEDKKNPFAPPIYGGVAHGLQIVEDIAWVYRLTGEEKYRDYAVWLYKAFSENPRRDNDIHYSFISKKDENFVGHSAHTFEHFRVLLDVWYFTGYPELETAVDNYQIKLEKVILPSGAGFGFENLWDLEAHPDSTPVEYCAITELELSAMHALKLTGDLHFADMAEKLFYNAAQGARLPDCKAVTYCRPDNCNELSEHHIGYFSPEEGIGYTHNDERYKYSPTHLDVAECCAPQSTRAYPYFVANMWMKSENGLAAMLYGPCKVQTKVNGTLVSITEKTDYPFADNMVIEIAPESSSEAIMDIQLRIPDYCPDMSVTCDGADIQKENGFFTISKIWKAEDKIQVEFNPEIKKHTANNNETYLQRGPLVYALNIPSEEKAVEDYPVEGFHDYHYYDKNEVDYHMAIVDDAKFTYNDLPMDENPWKTPPVMLTGTMFSPKEGKELEVNLVPMGSTILRRVTFPAK